MGLTISPSAQTVAAPLSAVRPASVGTIAGIPLYTFAVTLASLCTIIGIMWDISWHTTIGRDAFLSPPHILIYMGAIFGGLFSGIQVLWNTFGAPKSVRPALVRIWGIFYSSLGALFCIWGAIAMLTSAPFDDWWHNAYGLDVVILSPPHSLLGLGMLFLQFGACVSVSKYLNVAEHNTTEQPRQKTILQVLFVIAAASLICMIMVLATDYIDRREQRTGSFYIIASLALLLFLPAFAKALRTRYAATTIALTYFFIIAITNWVLQTVPAVPKLGPILNPVTHLQSLQFPLLIFVPALAIDLILNKMKANDWVKAALVSIAFVVLLFAVQYPFSGFLVKSPLARNWFFGSHSWYYGASPDWQYRYDFYPGSVSTASQLVKSLGIAIVAGLLICRLSLRWGTWLQKIKR